MSRRMIATSYEQFKGMENALLLDGFKYYDIVGNFISYRKIINGIVVIKAIYMAFWK